MVGDCWVGTWNPILEGTLLDQRVVELLSMQQSSIHKRPLCRELDGWAWENAPFSIQRAYTKIREGQSEEQHTTIWACRFIWRQNSALSTDFLWLLLHRRLMTHVFCNRIYPDISAECGLCSGDEEDYKHLLFDCPFACMI